MAKVIRKIEQKQVPSVAKKRVAAYARVSVPTERLLHSLDEQISYYSNLIQKTPGWEYAGVFADRGHQRHTVRYPRSVPENACRVRSRTY